MLQRQFGDTGLLVPVLGFGAGSIGGAHVPDSLAATILNEALDLGLTLIDTAPSYGESEARIGRHLSGRRSEFVLSTKVGYGIPGVPDWTYPCIVAGVNEALGRLRTDFLDIVHLHSCPADVLRRGDVIAALADCMQAGKIRVAAYSGDNEALDVAIAGGGFGSIEMSVSLCDQGGIDRSLGAAKARGMGVIAKRPLANAPWRFDVLPEALDVATYWGRWRSMGLACEMPPQELAIRFAAYTWGVDCCIVGSANPVHIKANAEAVAKGKLPEVVIALIRASFREHGDRWQGVI